jgi:hypothetical protein
MTIARLIKITNNTNNSNQGHPHHLRVMIDL